MFGLFKSKKDKEIDLVQNFMKANAMNLGKLEGVTIRPLIKSVREKGNESLADELTSEWKSIVNGTSKVLAAMESDVFSGDDFYDAHAYRKDDLMGHLNKVEGVMNKLQKELNL